MDNGEENDPGTPGTVPSAEAARSGGRRQALRQRSSAVQDQVTRRREELERSRHLGLLLLVRRRFKAIEGGDLSVLISLSLFVAMVPLVLLGFSWLTGFSSSANLASFVIRHYGLHEPVAGIVRDTSPAPVPTDPQRCSGSSAGRWPGSPGGVGAEDLRPSLAGADAPLMASYLRGGLWFLLYVATQFGVEAATWTPRAQPGPGGAGRPGRGGAHLRAVAGHPASAARQRPGRLARPGPHRDRRHRGDGGAAAAVAAAAAQVAGLVGDPVRGHRHQHRPAAWWSSCWRPAGWWWRPLAPSTGSASPTRTPSSGQNSTAEPPSRRRTVRLTGGRTTMVDDSDHQMQQPRRQRPRRLLQAFSSPDSYGLVLPS